MTKREVDKFCPHVGHFLDAAAICLDVQTDSSKLCEIDVAVAVGIGGCQQLMYPRRGQAIVLKMCRQFVLGENAVVIEIECVELLQDASVDGGLFGSGFGFGAGHGNAIWQWQWQ